MLNFCSDPRRLEWSNTQQDDGSHGGEMFWKSKEKREEERLEREKLEAEMLAGKIRLEQKKEEESDLLEELIRIPSRVGRYVVEAMSDDAAQSGRAFTESAEQVFFFDFIYIVLAFGRAEGALSYEMAKLLLAVGSGEVRQDSRSSKRINDAMWELQQTITGSSVSRQALEVITDNFAGLLGGDKELIVVPRTVLALEVYDQEHGTAYASETAKVFLKLVAKLAKGSDSIMYQPFDVYGPKAGWERPSLKAHQFVEERFKELLEEIATPPSSEVRTETNHSDAISATD